MEPLLKALDHYLAAVEKRPAADGTRPDLRPAMEQLESVALEHAPSADAQLRHYLTQRSYRKAYHYLRGEDHLNKAGNCGRH